MNEILLFVTRGKALENEVSQTEKDKNHVTSLRCGIQNRVTSEQTRKTHSHRQQYAGWPKGKGDGGGRRGKVGQIHGGRRALGGEHTMRYTDGAHRVVHCTLI